MKHFSPDKKEEILRNPDDHVDVLALIYYSILDSPSIFAKVLATAFANISTP
jgi:hypothetical protein